MSRASLLEVCVVALQWTYSSSFTAIGELESQLASKNLELNAATVELESTERRLRSLRTLLASSGSRFKKQGFSFTR